MGIFKVLQVKMSFQALGLRGCRNLSTFFTSETTSTVVTRPWSFTFSLRLHGHSRSSMFRSVAGKSRFFGRQHSKLGSLWSD